MFVDDCHAASRGNEVVEFRSEVKAPGFDTSGSPSCCRRDERRWWPALCKVLAYGAGLPREARRRGRAIRVLSSVTRGRGGASEEVGGVSASALSVSRAAGRDLRDLRGMVLDYLNGFGE